MNKTRGKQVTSEELDPYLQDILYDCIIGGWDSIEADGFTHVCDEKVVETINKILEHYTLKESEVEK